MHVSGFCFLLVGTETCTGTSLQMLGGTKHLHRRRVRFQLECVGSLIFFRSAKSPHVLENTRTILVNAFVRNESHSLTAIC